MPKIDGDARKAEPTHDSAVANVESRWGDVYE